MKKNRIFKGIVSLTFWVGVNVIGLPEIVEHKMALYGVGNTKREKPHWREWFGW